jgi:N-acetylmuramoyl-L-alanine amidase
MIAPIYAAIALTLAAPGGHRRPRVAGRAAETARRPAAKAGSPLDRARALLTQVKHDPSRRRYRHHWEKAIHALEKAARGRDKAPALLEAARARYALYRFSQIESDRDAALRLTVKAQRAGSRDAAAFAAAVRKERGDDEGEAPATAKRRGATAVARAPAAPAPAPGAAAPGTPDGARTAEPKGSTAAGDPEPSADPDLEKALATADGGDADADERATPSGPATVSEVKSWSNTDYTRVAIYLSRPVDFTQQELAAEGEHPRRLALDLSPALLDHRLAHAVGDSLVARVRAAQRDRDTVRVVLDLAGRDDFSIFSLEDPPRLIVDVGVREAQREAVASGRKSAGEPQAKAPPVKGEGEGEGEAAQPRPIRRIIVDAGHGGHDTGAIGPTRVREKDVTLAMAKRLAKQLTSRGFEVVLTRKDDTYLPLEERAAIANANHGDLFISLHANAHPRRDRRGTETYVLNVADDRYAARLAARENGTLRSDTETPNDVRRILSDLNALASADASRRLAEVVQRQLCAGVRAHIGEVRDLGVKSALFYVLLGARMPAVLVESAFISNKIEEQRLKSPRFQDEAATAIARAVETFAQREEHLASAR